MFFATLRSSTFSHFFNVTWASFKRELSPPTFLEFTWKGCMCQHNVAFSFQPHVTKQAPWYHVQVRPAKHLQNICLLCISHLHMARHCAAAAAHIKSAAGMCGKILKKVEAAFLRVHFNLTKFSISVIFLKVVLKPQTLPLNITLLQGQHSCEQLAAQSEM